jgi:hypothetical protein
MADPIRIAEALDYYGRIADERSKMFPHDNGDFIPNDPSIAGNVTPYQTLRFGKLGSALNRESIGAGPFSATGVFDQPSQDPTRSPEGEWRQKQAGLNFGGNGFSLGGGLSGNSANMQDKMAPTVSGSAGPLSGFYSPVSTPMGRGDVRGAGIDIGPVNVQAMRASMPLQKPMTSYEASGKIGNLLLQGAIEPRGAASIGAEYPLGSGTVSFAASRGPRYDNDRDYNALLRYNLRF